MHVLTDEEREMSLEVRRMKGAERRIEHEIAVAERELALAKIQAELSEYQEEDDDFAEKMFKDTILPRILGGGGRSIEQPPQPIQPDEATASITTEAAAEELIRTIPEDYRRVARKMPDGMLKNLLAKKTGYDADSIEMLVKTFRAKKL